MLSDATSELPKDLNLQIAKGGNKHHWWSKTFSDLAVGISDRIFMSETAKEVPPVFVPILKT